MTNEVGFFSQSGSSKAPAWPVGSGEGRRRIDLAFRSRRSLRARVGRPRVRRSDSCRGVESQDGICGPASAGTSDM